MGTKVKGILKGLRYISQIFEDEKEAEMQIGLPTDVKHVAHIGWDGPSVHSPSWMSKFRTTPEFSSAPLNTGVPEIFSGTQSTTSALGFEDSSRKGTRVIDSVARDLPELPRTSRRQSPSESPIREKSGKSKISRRHNSETSESTRIRRQHQDPTLPPGGSDSPLICLPDIPKKSRRKKSKDKEASISGSTTRPSRSKGSKMATTTAAATPNVVADANSSYTAPFSDPGPGPGAAPKFTTNASYKTSTLQEYELRQEKSGVDGISYEK